MLRLRRIETWPLRVIPRTILAQPFAVFLAALCIIAGVPLAISGQSSQSIEKALPSLLIHVWGAMLGGGGLLLLVGLIKPHDTVARAGLNLLGSASLAYTVAVIAYGGVRAIFTAAITLAFALACLVRGYVLRMGARFDMLIQQMQVMGADGDG